jgi:hypothetical protein
LAGNPFTPVNAIVNVAFELVLGTFKNWLVPLPVALKYGAGGAAVTVTGMVKLAFRLPLVPAIVIVPDEAVLDAVTVTVVFPGAFTELC